jgi:hypothetical protein
MDNIILTLLKAVSKKAYWMQTEQETSLEEGYGEDNYDDEHIEAETNDDSDHDPNDNTQYTGGLEVEGNEIEYSDPTHIHDIFPSKNGKCITDREMYEPVNDQYLNYEMVDDGLIDNDEMERTDGDVVDQTDFNEKLADDDYRLIAEREDDDHLAKRLGVIDEGTTVRL